MRNLWSWAAHVDINMHIHSWALDQPGGSEKAEDVRFLFQHVQGERMVCTCIPVRKASTKPAGRL